MSIVSYEPPNNYELQVGEEPMSALQMQWNLSGKVK